MSPHPFSADCGCPACWNTLKVALSEFRDSLMLLSLALHDLQFDRDLDSRKSCEEAVRNLFHGLGSDHVSGANRNPADPGG